jgi:hypothetical protein
MLFWCKFGGVDVPGVAGGDRDRIDPREGVEMGVAMKRYVTRIA